MTVASTSRCISTQFVDVLYQINQPVCGYPSLPAWNFTSLNMPPKKDDKKGAEAPKEEDGSERELVEKELVIGYLKTKLGR